MFIMEIKYHGGQGVFLASCKLPLVVLGKSGSGKTTLLQSAIPDFAKERNVYVMNPHHEGAYHANADRVVSVGVWLRDDKFRLPCSKGVTLLDFCNAPDDPDTICEVIDRIANLSQHEEAVLILDACNDKKCVDKLFAAQSDRLFCVAAVQSKAAVNLKSHELQILIP